MSTGGDKYKHINLLNSSSDFQIIFSSWSCCFIDQNNWQKKELDTQSKTWTDGGFDFHS